MCWLTPLPQQAVICQNNDTLPCACILSLVVFLQNQYRVMPTCVGITHVCVHITLSRQCV